MDVCIIGAGWSGIYACKYALENGMNPIVLEKRDGIGGVWNYSDSSEYTTVMKSTISSSSRVVTEASDFFMPEKFGHFMRHGEILEYLESYIRHFDLGPYLNFNSDVKSIEKAGGQWRVEFVQEGEPKVVVADRIAICAGLHNKKREITGPVSRFQGHVIHSGEIKEIVPDDYGEKDNVIVYGGGETASDLIDLLVETPAKITWAIRGGQHFLRKTLFRQRKGIGQFDKHDFALDVIASPLINAVSSFSKSAPGRRYITDWLSTGSFRKYQGHGIRAWKNKLKYAQQFFNKNGHSVDHVHSGRVRAENEIVEVDGRRITFKSGNCDEFTHVICCFGYEFHCPFLPKTYRSGDLHNHYQYVFPVNDPSIAFLGFARPIIGSIPLITEMQCLWAFRVLSGKIKLEDPKTLSQKQAEVNAKWDGKLPGRGQLKTLVLPSSYVASMIKEANPGRSPGDHFFKYPMRAFKFLSWIPSGSIRFAVDPNTSDEKFNELWNQKSHGLFLAYFLPVLIVFSRLFFIERLVDWWVERRDRQAAIKRPKRKSADALHDCSIRDRSRRPIEKKAA